MADDSSLGPGVVRALGTGTVLSGTLLASGLLLPPPLGTRLILAGIAVMVATPFARVLVLTVALGRRREWSFMWAGIAVLVLLTLSVFLGRVHA